MSLSRLLHKPGTKPGYLQCGRKCGDTCAHLPDGASFKWARCGICFKGEVIIKVDDLVDALDHVRAARSSSKMQLRCSQCHHTHAVSRCSWPYVDKEQGHTWLRTTIDRNQLLGICALRACPYTSDWMFFPSCLVTPYRNSSGISWS